MPAQLNLFDHLPEFDVGAKQTFKALEKPLWTENKAKLISAYLRYFVFITKHGAYIDGFTGPQDRIHLDTWAAKLVLESEPRWLNSFYLCERSKICQKAISKLISEQPLARRRTVEEFFGDFNLLIEKILASPGLGQQVATFCLLDQRTFECHWETVRKISQHKAANKIEIFYFLGTGWLDRSFSGIKNKSKLSAWWGSDGWTAMKGLKAVQRSELMCERFRSELGYKYAYGWPITSRSHGDRIMYYMVHASDHDDAPKLMSRAYRFATGMLAPKDNTQLELELKAIASNQEN